MKDRKALPTYGPGPYYVAAISIMTLAGILISRLQVFSPLSFQKTKIPFLITGIILIALGVVMWLFAVPFGKIDEGIKNTRLITTGIYACVRNPIYSAFAIALTGVDFIFNNLILFILPFIYWLLLTVILKKTEEKWLLEAFGEEYRDYLRRVNRCIPFIKRKK